jgi:hypothetical protein
MRIELTNPASVCILHYGLVPAAIECRVGGWETSPSGKPDPRWQFGQAAPA